MEGEWIQQRGLYVPSYASFRDTTYRVAGAINGLGAGQVISADTIPRYIVNNSLAAITPGTLYCGAIAIPAGLSMTGFCALSSSSAAGVGPTNQWMALMDNNLNVLFTTADRTNEAWPTGYLKFFSLVGGPFLAPYTGLYYLGLCYAGTSGPSLSCYITSGMSGLPPKLFGTSTTALTNPASLSSPIGALAAMSQEIYMGIVT